MPIATLLLRENNSTPLTQAVEKALQRKPPLLEYELQINSCQLDFLLLSKPEKFAKASSLDEGFESDIDTVSIVSSDESFTSTQEAASKNQETDSANGSACSDSDDTDSTTTVNTIQSKYSTLKKKDTDAPDQKLTNKRNHDTTKKETFNLVDCLCYTDVKAQDLLLFVIKSEVLVFRFANLGELQKFYASFSALKAVTSQKAYNKNYPSKFNLLQRTDSNGVTHIEISREPNSGKVPTNPGNGPTSIISINTPENSIDDSLAKKILNQKSRDDILLAKSSTLSRRPGDFKSNTISKFGSLYLMKERNKNFNSRQRNESCFFALEDAESKENSLNLLSAKSASIDNLLSELANEKPSEKIGIIESNLKKVWNSVEDLLSSDKPKKPERKRKPKGPAPQPPARTFKQNVLKGSYVRVNVPKFEETQLKPDMPNLETSKPEKIVFDHKATILRAGLPDKKENNFSKLQSLTEKAKNSILTSKPKLVSYQQFKYSEPKKLSETVSTLTRTGKGNLEPWTNSVPRLLKKNQQRSRSETRNFTPMAYRYIDTTQNSAYVINNASATASNFQLGPNYQGIGTFQRSKPNLKPDVTNRLFGMSSKLRDFSNSTTTPTKSDQDGRYSSLGELNYRYNNQPDNNLKSVIKKDDGKKKNEKKVTFSAYTTVQVV